MPMTPLRSARASRGYLLIETAVSGALFAILLASLFAELARARNQNVAASRDVVASQLVLECVERLRTVGLASTNSTCNTLPMPAGYTRILNVDGATTNEVVTLFNPPTSRNIPYKRAVVTVRYNINTGGNVGAVQTRQSQTTTRLY
jgi:type II secretory pathway pseudopilin PulG